MLYALILLAADEEGKGGGGIMQFLPIMAIMALFFFLFILGPQRRQRREQEALLSTMKKNDEVVTHSGIIGVVANIKDDEVTLKIDDNARIRVVKSTIARILKKDESAKEPAAATPPAPAAANTNVKPAT